MEKEENLVKKTCRELGITQKELAEKIGLSDRTMSKYARNTHIPKNIINHINLLVESQKQKNIFVNLKNSIKQIEEFLK